MAHGDLFRALVRRSFFLDPLAVLDDDAAMQARLEDFYVQLRAASGARPGPGREALLDEINEATRGAAALPQMSS